MDSKSLGIWFDKLIDLLKVIVELVFKYYLVLKILVQFMIGLDIL